MQHYLRRLVITMLGITALLAVHPESTEAQNGANARTPVFVAIPDAFPDIDARSILLRHPGRDIILLPPGAATPEALSATLGLLRRMREEDPRPARAQMIPVTGFSFRHDIAPERRSRLERLLARLHDRPVANVGDLGPGRWIRLGRS